MESRSETVLKGDEVVEEQFCWILKGEDFRLGQNPSRICP